MRKDGKKIHFFNSIYEKKNRYEKPKEIFSFLIRLLKNEKINKNSSIIDVGCSNGELLFNIEKNFKKLNLVGIDVDSKLLLKARKMCSPNIDFKKGNISKKINNIGKFDIVIFSGVLSIFNDGEKILKNLFSLLKPKGKVFIFDSFNIYSYNLYIKSETKKNNKNIIWYKNMYSTDFIKNFSKKLKKRTIFYEFRLKKKLKKNKENLNYGWTEYLSGKKIITSGLGLIQNQFWVKIY